MYVAMTTPILKAITDEPIDGTGQQSAVKVTRSEGQGDGDVGQRGSAGG